MVEKFVPKESEKYPGFYIVPDESLILISMDDRLIFSDNGEEIPVTVGSWGYKVATLLGRFIHSIKCSAFNGPCPNYDKMMVNHKDGIKLNNDPSNLEWVTRSQNAIHAYESGLRTDNTPLLVKDIKTDIIAEYYSLQACARALEVNGGSIHKFLNKKDKLVHVFLNQYAIIRKGDPWPAITKEDLSKVIKGRVRPIIVIDNETGDSKVYACVADAALELDINKGSLAVYVNRIKETGQYVYKGYTFKYVDDPDLIQTISKLKMASVKRGKLKPRKPVPIEVTDLKTGEVHRFPSSQYLADQLGVLKNTLQKGVYVGNGIWRGMKLVYLTEK